MNNLDLTTIEIINPTSETFTWRWNGQPYTIAAGEKKAFARPIAYHLAKHLSTQIITLDASRRITNKEAENPNAAIHMKISQLGTYDTHERRIALFDILGDEQLVINVIKAYPFKGFIGDMDEYKKHVEKRAEERKGVVAK